MSGNSKMKRETPERGEGRDRKGGLIRNLAMMGGNTRREWGDRDA